MVCNIYIHIIYAYTFKKFQDLDLKCTCSVVQKTKTMPKHPWICRRHMIANPWYHDLPACKCLLVVYTHHTHTHTHTTPGFHIRASWILGFSQLPIWSLKWHFLSLRKVLFYFRNLGWKSLSCSHTKSLNYNVSKKIPLKWLNFSIFLQPLGALILCLTTLIP